MYRDRITSHPPLTKSPRHEHNSNCNSNCTPCRLCWRPFVLRQTLTSALGSFNEAKSKLRPGVTENLTITYSEQGTKLKRPRRVRTKTANPFTAAYELPGDQRSHRCHRRAPGRKSDVVGNDHDLEGWQNAHGNPSLDRREVEEVHCEKGLRQELRV